MTNAGLYNEDLTPIFIANMLDFELYKDGEWRVWQDGKVIASGAFDRRDLTNLAETSVRIEQSKVGLFDDDRIEAH